MKLNLDFSSYKGATLLKDWWKRVKEHFEAVQEAVNANDAAITKEVSDRKSAVSGEASARQSADTALGQRIDGKADAVHKHVKADITDFAHTHTKSEISDFPDTMPPSVGSVTMDKLAEDVTAAIEGATGLDELDGLRRDVYGRKTTTQAKGIQINPFSLSFKCTKFDNKSIPNGTWECTDVSGICSAIEVEGQPLQAHPTSSPDKITVTDDYLENNGWEITAIINLDPNDVDNYPVLGLSSFVSEKEPSYSGAYPYVKSVTETTLRIALGCIALPDSDVQVGGSEQILSVNGKSLTYDKIIDIGPNTNAELATEDKRSIVAAVNELAAKANKEVSERQSAVSSESGERKSADTALGERIDDETAARETLVKEVGIPPIRGFLSDTADFRSYEAGKEYLVKIVGDVDNEIGDVWFQGRIACSHTGDQSYYTNKSGQEVKVGYIYAFTKYSEPYKPNGDIAAEYIDGEVSFVESSVVDWAQRNIFGFDSLTKQLEALKADVEYLQDNVIYRMDGVE